MVDNVFRLMTAIEAEEELGSKYFYRQKTYRYQKSGKLKAFAFRGKQCFLPHLLIKTYLDDLEEKLRSHFPELSGYRVFFDEDTRRVIVDGLFGKYIAAASDKETEEDLLNKIRSIIEWMASEISEEPEPHAAKPEAHPAVDKPAPVPNKESNDLSTAFDSKFLEDIQFVKIETGLIEGVEVKSYILISLPSISQFIGVRSDQFSEWVQQTSFVDFVVSAHPKRIHGPEISGPWKRGFSKGSTPLLPLELIPELLVAFRQSGRTPAYPARAEQLYMMAQSTLEAVGLAISGNQSKAAAELAKVSEGLGISTADQVIEIFKRYESRPFQINTNRKFVSKVRKQGNDISTVTGAITFGVTGRYPGAWKALGAVRKLPSKHRTSGREVMRQIEPSASVGITFSESHYIKDSSNLGEVIETGKKGKEFYERLKDVGLLED